MAINPMLTNEWKVCAHRLYRIASPLQSFNLENIFSMIWRRLYKLLSYDSGFFLFVFGGIHTLFPLRMPRILNASYALSAIKFLMRRKFLSINSGAAFTSCVCPGVMQKSIGSASSLQSKCILVVKPPQLLPIFLGFPSLRNEAAVL